ncbi:MAG: hypothetical protein RUDDFDWM_000881 [Candidatus Fervidibacterota bacterium]
MGRNGECLMQTKRLFALACVLLIALFIRTLGIVGRDLYCDEAVVLLYSKLPWERLLKILPHENYGPLWFVVQKLWNEVDGYVWARVLSVVAGTVVVWIAFEIGMLCGGIWLALVCGLITATNCYLVYFSQKVWSYIPCTAFLAIAMLLAMHILKASECNCCSKKQYHLVALYCVFALLSFYTHFISIPPLLAIALIGAFHLRRNRYSAKAWCMAQIVTFAMMLPWAKFLLSRTMSVAKGFHMSHAGLLCLLDMFHDFSMFAPSVHHSVIHARIITILAFLTFAYLFVYGLLICFRSQCESFPAFVFVLSVLLWLLVSVLVPVWHPRTLLPVLPAYCFIVSCAIAKHKKALAIALLCFVLCLNASSLAFYFFDEAYAEAQWKEVASYLKRHRKHSELILHSSVLSFPPISYHLGSTAGHKVVGLSERTATAATAFALLIEPNASFESIDELERGKFWLVETTDWRPWVKWKEDEVTKKLRLRKDLKLKLVLKMRGVSIYECFKE